MLSYWVVLICVLGLSLIPFCFLATQSYHLKPASPLSSPCFFSICCLMVLTNEPNSMLSSRGDGGNLVLSMHALIIHWQLSNLLHYLVDINLFSLHTKYSNLYYFLLSFFLTIPSNIEKKIIILFGKLWSLFCVKHLLLFYLLFWKSHSLFIFLPPNANIVLYWTCFLVFYMSI